MSYCKDKIDKMHQIQFPLGFCPRPNGERAYRHFMGPTSNGRGGKTEGKIRGEGRRGNRREERASLHQKT